MFPLADSRLLEGLAPEVDEIARQLKLPRELVAAGIKHWWQTLSGRVRLANRNGALPEMPEAVGQAFMRIWQQAVQEARVDISLHRQQDQAGAEENRRMSEDALRQTQQAHQELESRFREQETRLEEARELTRSLEAEVETLRNALTTEADLRKQAEYQRSTLESEAEQVRKQLEDVRQSAEQRFKDEQRKSVEANARADVEVRHYRSLLDKLRDESGRKESELTRELKELQGQLARKEVHIDTQNSQLKSLEEELAVLKQAAATRQRDLGRLESQLLSEGNKNKRLEDKSKNCKRKSSGCNSGPVALRRRRSDGKGNSGSSSRRWRKRHSRPRHAALHWRSGWRPRRRRSAVFRRGSEPPGGALTWTKGFRAAIYIAQLYVTYF